MSIQTDGPWPHVAAAFFCERVLIERDGAASAIRIVDTMIAEVPNELGVNQGIPVDLTIFVSLKAGEFKGIASVAVQHTPPGGTPDTPLAEVLAAATKSVESARSMSYETLLATHLEDHRKLFRRVAIDLKQDSLEKVKASSTTPTDRRGSTARAWS